MTSKTTKTLAPARLASTPGTGPYQVQPWTTEERLRHIEALARQIHTYVEFVCQVKCPTGTSGEVREKAITDFYNRIVVMERELGRIHQELKLA